MGKECNDREFNLLEIVENTFVENTMPMYKKRHGIKSAYDWHLHLWKMGKRKQTPEIVREAIEHDDGECGPILKFISKKLLTREICQLAVSKSGINLKYVPYGYRDYDLCSLAVKTEGAIITEVPEELIDFQLCYSAVCNDSMGLALSSVPQFLLQGDKGKMLYDAAVRTNGMALKCIPRSKITEELAFLAVENPPRIWHDYPIKYVPEKYISEKLVASSFSHDPSSLRCIPAKYISQNLCFNLVRKAPENIRYIPTELLSDVLIDMALNLDPTVFRCIPKERMTKERWHTVLQQVHDFSLDEFPEEVCDNVLKGIRLSETQHQPLKLPLPMESNGSIIPKSLSETALVHELALEDSLPIYYITDLHLEHQLPLRGKSLYETIQLIDGKVAELTNSVQDTSGILLVGGDIADSYELVALFYKELEKRWKGEIIAVLGNHELWEAEHKGVPVDKVIREYQKKLGCRTHVLENELYIVYKGILPQSLNEGMILDSSTEDLRKVCENSTCILLGGVGFSGCNPIYNAAGGLYRTAITTEEDISRSSRFRAIYNKVLACAGKLPVIVMTHTKMSDWSDDSYNPNWIYLHGHTHQNTLILNDSATVLADNQVGYTPKKWHLNGFTFNRQRYDPFKEYPDGIHIVELQQYIDFNRGMLEFRHPGTIYMIKRDNYYMFTLKSTKSLCILSGGARERLTHSMDYYYENLTRYASVVKAAFTPYHDALKKISNEVKAIGGDGRIHGCIVDIDWYNHLYLDPCDGHIIPYFALNMTQKIRYETVRCLLQDSPFPPHRLDGKLLLENYDKKQKDGSLLALANPQEGLNNVAVVPEIFLDRSMYKPSRIMRSVQYLLDGNVVRVWKDEILARPNGTQPIHLQLHKKQLKSSE